MVRIMTDLMLYHIWEKSELLLFASAFVEKKDEVMDGDIDAHGVESIDDFERDIALLEGFFHMELPRISGRID
jgi:hypothetical protein